MCKRAHLTTCDIPLQRTGSALLDSHKLTAAPPTKKFAREVRRKKVMLYIDSSAIQVMAPEEKTVKHPMSEVRNVGYSLDQFFLVICRRNRIELFEFKTKEALSCQTASCLLIFSQT